MSYSLGVGEIIHGNEVEVLVSERSAKNVASDAPKSIDANFYSHDASKRNFDCLRKICRNLERTLMVTGSSSQRKCQADTGVISIPVSVLRHRKGTRASQYFALIIRRTRANSSGGRMRAVAGNSGPVIFPRTVHRAILTCGLLRMRLYFPVLLLVIK